MKLLHTGTFVLTAEVDALNMIEARALWLCSSRPATLTNPETHLARLLWSFNQVLARETPSSSRP